MTKSRDQPSHDSSDGYPRSHRAGMKSSNGCPRSHTAGLYEKAAAQGYALSQRIIEVRSWDGAHPCSVLVMAALDGHVDVVKEVLGAGA